MTKRIWLALLALAALGLLVLASSGFGDSSVLSTSEHSTVAVVQDAVGLAQARSRLSVLRGSETTARDRIPVSLAHTALFTGDPVDLDTTRMVRSVGRSAWLANSSDGRSVCEISNGTLACPPVEDIERHGLSPAIFTRAGEPVHVSGIASDEVTGVDVVLADGTVKSVPVEQNFFMLDTVAIPRELRWIGPTGPEVFAFPQGVMQR